MVISVCPLIKSSFKKKKKKQNTENLTQKGSLVRVRLGKDCSGSNIEKEKRKRTEKRIGTTNPS